VLFSTTIDVPTTGSNVQVEATFGNVTSQGLDPQKTYGLSFCAYSSGVEAIFEIPYSFSTATGVPKTMMICNLAQCDDSPSSWASFQWSLQMTASYLC